MTYHRNVYTCAAGHATWTRDLHNGVTPFLIPCQTKGCEEDATSSFYRISSDPQPATHEWYKPGWWARLWLGPNSKEHVRQGGLLLREMT